MLWEEPANDRAFEVPRDVIDLSFRIACRTLPLDHAWMLYESIRHRLPWIDEDSRVAIHSIHGAASGNGWIRPPNESGSLLQLPQRTRLYLRIPSTREQEAQALSGQELRLGPYRIRVGDSRPKTLVPTDTLFSRSVTDQSVHDEEAFTHWMADQLGQRGIRLRKMLCGLQHTIHHPQGILTARSVMLSDLEYHAAIRLQETGVGDEQKLGCGIFLPHKSLAAVGLPQEDG